MSTSLFLTGYSIRKQDFDKPPVKSILILLLFHIINIKFGGTKMKALNFKMPAWITGIISAIIILVAVFTGGVADQDFPGKDGKVYNIVYEQTEGVIGLIDDCKLVKNGDSCTVSVKVKATLKSGGSDTATAAPVTTEPVKTDTAPITEPVKDTLPAQPAEVKAVQPADAKPVEPAPAETPVPAEEKKEK